MRKYKHRRIGKVDLFESLEKKKFWGFMCSKIEVLQAVTVVCWFLTVDACRSHNASTVKIRLRDCA